VAHSSTTRALKGTADFLKACEGLTDVVPVLIEGVSNAECLRRKGGCHVTFDSLHTGFQVSGLEGGAIGMPVVCGGDEYIREEYLRRYGSLPAIWSGDAEQLREALIRLRDDAQFYEDARDNTVSFVRDVHGHTAASEHMLSWLSED